MGSIAGVVEATGSVVGAPGSVAAGALVVSGVWSAEMVAPAVVSGDVVSGVGGACPSWPAD